MVSLTLYHSHVQGFTKRLMEVIWIEIVIIPFAACLLDVYNREGQWIHKLIQAG